MRISEERLDKLRAVVYGGGDLDKVWAGVVETLNLENKTGENRVSKAGERVERDLQKMISHHRSFTDSGRNGEKLKRIDIFKVNHEVLAKHLKYEDPSKLTHFNGVKLNIV